MRQEALVLSSVLFIANNLLCILLRCSKLFYNETDGTANKLLLTYIAGTDRLAFYC